MMFFLHQCVSVFIRGLFSLFLRGFRGTLVRHFDCIFGIATLGVGGRLEVWRSDLVDGLERPSYYDFGVDLIWRLSFIAGIAGGGCRPDRSGGICRLSNAFHSRPRFSWRQPRQPAFSRGFACSPSHCRKIDNSFAIAATRDGEGIMCEFIPVIKTNDTKTMDGIFMTFDERALRNSQTPLW